MDAAGRNAVLQHRPRSLRDGRRRILQMRFDGVQERLANLDKRLQEESADLRAAIESAAPALLRHIKEKAELTAVADECAAALLKLATPRS